MAQQVGAGAAVAGVVGEKVPLRAARAALGLTESPALAPAALAGPAVTVPPVPPAETAGALEPALRAASGPAAPLGNGVAARVPVRGVVGRVGSGVVVMGVVGRVGNGVVVVRGVAVRAARGVALKGVAGPVASGAAVPVAGGAVPARGGVAEVGPGIGRLGPAGSEGADREASGVSGGTRTA